MRILDLDSLEIFRTIVHEGGVVRAASKLNRVPSNVTTRIKQLEEKLGVALFQRRGRTIAATEAGRTLLVYAERLLQLAAEAETATLQSREQGHLKIGSMESTAASRLPKLLAAFHQSHPLINLTIETATTGALLQRVRDYRLEAAFVGEPFDVSGLSTRPVFHEKLVLITEKGHAPVKRATDVRSRTILAFPRGCSYRRRLDEWLLDAGVTAPAVLEFSSYHAIIACASSGAGIAIMPASVVETFRRSTDVAVHALPAAIGRNTTHLVWNGEPSPQLAHLLNMVPSTDK